MEKELLRPVKISKAKSTKKDGNNIGAKLYFSKKFSDLFESNKKYVDFMKTDKHWQKYRKKLYKVSNFLDNYYSQYHNRAWYPSGVYQVKTRYNHTESGLEHIYEKNNVEQLKPIDIVPKDKKKLNIITDSFIETLKAKEGEYLIIIEYCSSCEEHSNITQHLSDNIYKDLALK